MRSMLVLFLSITTIILTTSLAGAQSLEGKILFPIKQHLQTTGTLNGLQTGELDFSSIVPSNATHVVVKTVLDVNGYGNDGVHVHADMYPALGDFTGFNTIDNKIGWTDVANGVEEQIVCSSIVPLSSGMKTGWLVNPTGGSTTYHLGFWIQGYYVTPPGFVHLKKHIQTTSQYSGVQTGELDFSSLVPSTAVHVVVKTVLDVNGFANDGIHVHADTYPDFGDFTGFDTIDNKIGWVDVANGVEEQIVITETIPLSSDQKVGWKVAPTGDSSTYFLGFWIQGYYVGT